MTTPTAHLLVTVSTTDETTTDPDVIAAAEVNSVHEVYPEALVPPADGDPVWVEPKACGVLTASAVRHLLACIEVGTETTTEDDPHYADAQALLAWAEHVRANVDLTA